MKNKIIIGVVALVVIGVGVWYFALRGGGVVLPGQVINNPETMAALIAAGRPVKCAVAPTADNNNMVGTFYMAGKKVRGDYSVNDGEQALAGHMIVDGQVTYSWFEGQPTGFKMTNTVEPGKGNTPVTENQGFDPNQELGYKCEGWAADASKFVLPTNVKFTEFGATAEVITPPAGGAAGSAAQCAACDQVPASYKAQCRSSLGCK